MTPWLGKHFRVNLDFSEHVERPYYNFKKTIADTFIWHFYLTLNKLHIFEKDFLKQNYRCMHTNESSIRVYFKGWFETQFVYEKCVFPFKKNLLVKSEYQLCIDDKFYKLKLQIKKKFEITKICNSSK